MDRDQLIANLISIGVSEHQIDQLLQKYALEKLIEHYEVVNYKKNIRKETGIRNWAAFFYKNITTNANIEFTKRQIRDYYTKQKSFEEQKQKDIEDEQKQKIEKQEFKADYHKMKAIIETMTPEQKKNMYDKVDQFIIKELGSLPPFGLDMLRSMRIIETFKHYNWDIKIIKERLE
jgi:hypothetical protein